MNLSLFLYKSTTSRIKTVKFAVDSVNMSNTLGQSLHNHSLCRTNVVVSQSRANSGNYLFQAPAIHATLQLSKSLVPTKFCENLRLRKGTLSRRSQRMVSVVPCAVLATDPAPGLVTEVKEKLERDHQYLPVGRNGRDDEEMIHWFLKDRKFDVEAAVSKLSKAIKWRQEFGVSELSEESLKRIAGTGKAYIHESLDVNGRPVLIVVASKHFPGKEDPMEDKKLCVFLIEKALSRVTSGKEEILGIFDLRGFKAENADLEFLKFLFDVFYYYYPRRLGQVLYVDAPFVFQPLWQLVKPLLKSYASLVKFCSAETVRKEYFTEATAPAQFREQPPS